MELRIQGVNSFATGPAWASYDVDAATMHMERHERGIHACGAHSADGVIVASALVKAILGAPDAAAGAATVAELTAELRLATHRHGIEA